MKQIRLEQFEIEDALKILVRQEQYGDAQQSQFEKWAKINKEGGPAYSAYHEDTLLACAGIRIMWNGVGEAWGIFAAEIVNFKREAYAYTAGEIDTIFKDYNLHRVQAHADQEFELAGNFLEGLGFKQECLMEKFQPNKKNSYLYSLVR